MDHPAEHAEHAETIANTMAALSRSDLLAALNAGLTNGGDSTIDTIDATEPPVQGTDSPSVREHD
jgi:hypothetical protein